MYVSITAVTALAMLLLVPADPVLAAVGALPECTQIAEIGVGGSGEPQGPGSVSGPALAAFDAALPAGITTSSIPLNYTALDVPSAIDNAFTHQGLSYEDSRNDGITKLHQLLVDEMQKCPQQRFVFAGWSQGADVVATTLQRLDPSLTNEQALLARVAAIGMFGDPLFNPADNLVDTGSFDPTLSGLITGQSAPVVPLSLGLRPVFSTNLATHVVSYCKQGDVMCNASPANGATCFGAAVGEWMFNHLPGATMLAPIMRNQCAHVKYTMGDDPATTRAGQWMAARVQRSLAIPLILETDVPRATVGVPYSTLFTAIDGTAPYTWRVAPNETLPSGLHIAGNGVISGIPKTEGSSATTIRVVDAAGKRADMTYVFNRNPATPFMATLRNPTTANVGSYYYGGLNLSGGIQPYVATLKSGALPDGLTLSANGVVSGMPTTVQSTSFVIKARDDARTVFNISGSIIVGQALPKPIISTIAGTNDFGYSGDGAAASSAALNYPLDVASGANGDLYIADTDNGAIRRIDTNGTITTIAGTGEIGSIAGDMEGQPATQTKLYYPIAVAVGADNSVYFAESWRIRKITPTGELLTVLYQGPAAVGQNWQPESIAVDASNNLYIADAQNNVVDKLTQDGTLTTYAGTGVRGRSDGEVSATHADLDTPNSLSIESSGALLINTVGGNSRIYRVDSTGFIHVVLDGTSSGGTSATLVGGGTPISVLKIAAAPDGSIYFSDGRDCRVKNLSYGGGNVTIVAGSDTCGVADDGSAVGDGGAADQAWLLEPNGIAVTPQASYLGTSLVFTDKLRIRKVTFQ